MGCSNWQERADGDKWMIGYKPNLISGIVWIFAASAVLQVLLAVANLRYEGCFFSVVGCRSLLRSKPATEKKQWANPLQAQEVLFVFSQKRIRFPALAHTYEHQSHLSCAIILGDASTKSGKTEG